MSYDSGIRPRRGGCYANSRNLIDMTQPVPVNEFNSVKKWQWVKVHWDDAKPEWGYITGNIYSYAINEIAREVSFSPPSDIQYQTRYVGVNQISKICPEVFTYAETRLNKNCENCDHRFECFTSK